jgi:hypothetical protein
MITFEDQVLILAFIIFNIKLKSRFKILVIMLGHVDKLQEQSIH